MLWEKPATRPRRSVRILLCFFVSSGSPFVLMRNTLLKANLTARCSKPWLRGGVDVNGGMPVPDLEAAFPLRF
jgi:hypothetical protein